MRALDIFTSVTLIISVYLCGVKPKIGWCLYTINCIFYCLLMYLNELYGMAIVGVILFFIGLKNWLKTKK